MKLKSKRLEEMRLALSKSQSKQDRDKIWSSVVTPLIEDIPDNVEEKLVTFLYQVEDTDSRNQTIYLYSTIMGLPFSENSRLIAVPETDILFLSLELPATLSTAYNFLKVDETINEQISTGPDYHASDNFVLTGEFKRTNDMLMNLFQHNRVEIDVRNKNKVIYYMDFENPDKYFGMESILELPLAPKHALIPASMELAKIHRDKLKKDGRLKSNIIEFANTSLKDIEGYKSDKKDNKTCETRKYWIYLPPEYSKQSGQEYPLMLFLDGSEYINTIPAPSILDEMINDKTIPACIAVFFEYSSDRRIREYDCNDQFTSFLAKDLMLELREKNGLSITNNPKLITIVGTSASGLAAFYAGLTYPSVFGNVIAQSPSFEMKKINELNGIIDHHLKQSQDTQFSIEVGNYENIPIELLFSDGTKQACSSNQASKNVLELMKQNNMKVIFHEFIGGHNSVCWKNTLPNRLKELYDLHQENNFQPNF